MFNLSVGHIVVIVVVAILIFGERLPQVAAEAAHWLLKVKRSLSDLRRDSGIDREIQEVRRAVENAVPREVRSFNVERSLQDGVQTLKQAVAAPVVKELESVREAVTMPEHETPGPEHRLLEDRREARAPREDQPAVNPVASDPLAPPPAAFPRP